MDILHLRERIDQLQFQKLIQNPRVETFVGLVRDDSFLRPNKKEKFFRFHVRMVLK